MVALSLLAEQVVPTRHSHHLAHGVDSAGEVALSGYDVSELTGGVPVGEEETYKRAVGAGPDVWTSVG